MLLSGRAAGTGLSAVLRRFGTAAGKELVDERVHFPDFGVAEMARQQRRKVIDHAPPLHLADSVGCRADEHPAVLVLAVLLVVTHFDRSGLLGIRRERFECSFQRVLKIATHVACPADVERAPAPVEYDAGLVLMGAARVRQPVYIDVVEPRPESHFDLGLADSASQKDGAVNVDFGMHGLLRERSMLCRERPKFNPDPRPTMG